jgi:hypothetical protein
VYKISQGLTILGGIDEGEDVVCILYIYPKMLSLCRLPIFIKNNIIYTLLLTHMMSEKTVIANASFLVDFH